MPHAPPAAVLRITYQRYGELRDDTAQMALGGLLVKAPDVSGLDLASRVTLELVLPDGAILEAEVGVLHLFPGVGVAVTITPEMLDQVRQLGTGKDAGAGPARHERVDRSATPDEPAAPGARARSTTGAAPYDSLTNPEKIQLALHGNRDQRNAVLRDTNRTLHPFVLKNPQITTEDILAIAKNAQINPEVLRQISDRKEWFQRAQIAIALARNPKTPPDIAVRALDHVPIDVLRQLAKGTGAMPHVVQAARKKVIK